MREMNNKDKLKDLYNSLLAEGMKKEDYYNLICIMDSYGVERNPDDIRIVNGLAKSIYSFSDGYDCE